MKLLLIGILLTGTALAQNPFSPVSLVVANDKGRAVLTCLYADRKATKCALANGASLDDVVTIFAQQIAGGQSTQCETRVNAADERTRECLAITHDLINGLEKTLHDAPKRKP